MLLDAKKRGKKTFEEIEADNIKKLKNIPLWLDSYNDIFSDFDPRPFKERALSVDFLDEARRAALEKKEGLELIFLLKGNIRELKDEELIKKRLKSHFKKHEQIDKKEYKKIIYKGFSFFILGIILMFLAALYLYKNSGSFISTVLIIILEPAGWFLFWEGLNQVLFESKRKKPDYQFNSKMSKAEIRFESY